MRNDLYLLLALCLGILSCGKSSGSGAKGVNLENSTFIASPNRGIEGNGIATALLKVTLVDDDGNPVSGRSVAFSAEGEDFTLTQPTSETDSDGVATGTITSDVEGLVQVTAFLGGSSRIRAQESSEEQEETPSGVPMPNVVHIFFGDAFAPQKAFGIGGGGIDFVIDDFNLDGVKDIAATSQGLDTVSLLLGLNISDGTITFAPLFFEAGTDPTGIVAADFNADGLMDIACANAGDGTVSILLGNGNATFQKQDDPNDTLPDFPTYSVGVNPVDLVSGDFNGDGFVDLMTLNQTDNTLSFLAGNGDGTFDDATSPAFGNAATQLEAADFGGSGVLDLVLLNSGDNTIQILRNNGSASFTSGGTLTPSTGANRFNIGQFDSDDNLDIIVATNGTGADEINLFPGNGDRTFEDSTIFDASTSTRDVILADFDGNLIPDLLYVDTGNQFRFRSGDGLGTFDAESATGFSVNRFKVEDMNGDGIVEIIGIAGDIRVLSIPSE